MGGPVLSQVRLRRSPAAHERRGQRRRVCVETGHRLGGCRAGAAGRHAGRRAVERRRIVLSHARADRGTRAIQSGTMGPRLERHHAAVDPSADVRTAARGSVGVRRSAERRRDARRVCDRAPVGGRPRARVSRRHRPLEKRGDGKGLHRAAGFVAQEPPAGSGAARPISSTRPGSASRPTRGRRSAFAANATAGSTSTSASRCPRPSTPGVCLY